MGSSKCCCPTVKVWQSRMFYSGAKDWSRLLWRCMFVFTFVTRSHLLSVGHIVYSVVFVSGQYFYQAAHWIHLSLPGIQFWVMLQQPGILYTNHSESLKKREECVCVNVCVCARATCGMGSAFLSLAEVSSKAMEGIT